jgi:sirohydrochlorin cobaltochelatase
MTGVHPIEEESYRRLAGEVDLSPLPPGPAAVAARVVHATAEPALGTALVCPEAAVAAGVAALRAGAPVLCDVEMVRAGVGRGAVCLLSVTKEAGAHPTRTAAAMAAAARAHPRGAVVAVGCAPSALAEVNRLLAEGWFRPALVVGVPVGYVGAAESKAALLQAAGAAGVPAIVLPGDRGGAAVAAAVVNALGRLADGAPAPSTGPGLFLICHGTRSPEGEAQARAFGRAVAAARRVPCEVGFIEFCRPGLDEAVAALVARGVRQVVGVPLVLLGAGHLKDDGPAALARARDRHLGVTFTYARELGPHPDVLAVVGERIAAAAATLEGGAEGVVVVGRGSSDPEANAELVKAARLLADGRALAAGPADPGPEAAAPLALVEPAFVSLARPDVAGALDRALALGARRLVVAPYFLFTGLLVERMAAQARDWAAAHPGTQVVMAGPMDTDPRLVDLVWTRFEEAAAGAAHMNCDGCLYRAPLPGYEHRTGAPPFAPS